VGSSTSRDDVGVEERTPHHLAGVGRVVIAIERAADDRAHAIGADDDFRIGLSAISEGEDDAVASLL
jgi:hypothetical protein